MYVTRRELLKTGAAGAALLTLADCARASRFRVDADRRTIVTRIADAMLDGAIPPGGAARETALATAVSGFSTAVAGLTPSVAQELSQLFGLLEFAPTRRIVAGLPPWKDATRADVSAFLTRWRFSSFALLRSGYDALHELIMAGWYGQSAAWVHIGYPGPPDVTL